MKIAYLIDCDALGGGMEYIHRQMEIHRNDETRIFVADRGECKARTMNAWGADLIHVNHLKALLQLFSNPFSHPSGRVVFTVHGIHLRKYSFLPKTFLNQLKRLLRLRLERWLYGKCDELIALTETDALDIHRLYGEKLPVKIIPNTNVGLELRKPIGLRYGFHEFAFVCIARFDFQKGQDVLIRAIAEVQDELRGKGCRTLFVGDGGTLGEIRRLSCQLGVDDLTVFAGPIRNAGVYMTCGRVLVAPSRWEGMPYLLLEAIAREWPVVASDCPGNRDVLRLSPRVTLFPVGDVAALADCLVDVAQKSDCRTTDLQSYSRLSGHNGGGAHGLSFTRSVGEDL